MWWNNMEEEYTDILPLKTRKLLKTSKVTSPIFPTTCSERWANIAYLKGMQTMEDEIYATAFAYYISLIMTGMGISATSEYVYFKESLEDIVFNLLNTVKQGTHSEQEQKLQLWNEIYAVFYKTDIACAHEKTLKCGTLHIPRSMKNALKEKGTIHEAIVSLMLSNLDVTQEKKVIVPSGEKVQVTLQLTYTEQKKFNQIPGDSPTQKVLWLLS